jgi:hypothetical protein
MNNFKNCGPAYLNAGTGRPWAWQSSPNPRPECLTNERTFVSLANVGALAPTGSAHKTMQSVRRPSKCTPTEYQRVAYFTYSNFKILNQFHKLHIQEIMDEKLILCQYTSIWVCASSVTANSSGNVQILTITSLLTSHNTSTMQLCRNLQCRTTSTVTISWHYLTSSKSLSILSRKKDFKSILFRFITYVR